MKLAVKIARQFGGAYKAWCPALPGCAVLSPSRLDALSRIQTAATGYLASLEVALPRELGRMFKGEMACKVA
jgi:predicted RNase H-like HicB family nuclease